MPNLPVSTTHSDRPSWDKTWMSVAYAVSRRSLCERDNVGAVIVNKDNRIIATGYNNPPAGFAHNDQPCAFWCVRAITLVDKLHPEYHDCFSLHAEANALMVCDRRDREGGTIYVTSGICFTCAKLIANSGLTRVVVAAQHSTSIVHRNCSRSINLLEICDLKVDHVTVYV